MVQYKKTKIILLRISSGSYSEIKEEGKEFRPHVIQGHLSFELEFKFTLKPPDFAQVYLKHTGGRLGLVWQIFLVSLKYTRCKNPFQNYHD